MDHLLLSLIFSIAFSTCFLLPKFLAFFPIFPNHSRTNSLQTPYFYRVTIGLLSGYYRVTIGLLLSHCRVTVESLPRHPQVRIELLLNNSSAKLQKSPQLCQISVQNPTNMLKISPLSLLFTQKVTLSCRIFRPFFPHIFRIFCP